MGCTHFDDACIGKSCALASRQYRHLSSLWVCDRRRSPSSVSLLTLVRGDGEKSFDASAIEDDGGTKMKTNGADSARILHSLFHKGVMVRHTPRGSLCLRERRLNVHEQ